jgi:hypothetical protein
MAQEKYERGVYQKSVGLESDRETHEAGEFNAPAYFLPRNTLDNIRLLRIPK